MSVHLAGTVREVLEYGKQFYFSIQIQSTKPEVTTNALQLLMQSRCNPKFPPKQATSGKATRKQCLYDDLLNEVEKSGASWTNDTVTSGGKFLQELCNLLWMIDPHTDKRRFCISGIFNKTGYNKPSSHGHKVKRLDQDTLGKVCHNLYCYMEKPWMNKQMFEGIKLGVEEVLVATSRVLVTMKQDAQRHAEGRECDRDERDVFSIHTLPVPAGEDEVKISTHLQNYYSAVNSKLELHMLEYDPVNISQLLPTDRRERYRFKHSVITAGFRAGPTVWYSWSPGSQLETLHFVWLTTPEDNHDEKQAKCIKGLEASLPHYHSALVKKSFIKCASRLNVKPHMARTLYEIATSDASASAAKDKEIDERVMSLCMHEDEEIVMDLRALNHRPRVYEEFFNRAAVISDDIIKGVETAVDDRRHDNITHLAAAMSTADLFKKVVDHVGGDVATPSLSWFAHQFWPKNRSYKSARLYSGRLKVKHMVQQRQHRLNHPDIHYASAIFRYLKELGCQFREQTTFLSVDDKCKIPVGEPGQPIAAVARGRRVLVGLEQTFTVGDHDFSRCSLTPSITFKINVPNDVVSGSWYEGQVHVTLKDAVFQPSSPMRHAVEYVNLLSGQGSHPVLLMYSDGGPDHRCTYLSVILSMVYVWKSLSCDLLILARTPPGSSWKNPAERVMSQLNLGLQSVGMMRQPCTSAEIEQKLQSCNSMKSIREAADNDANGELRSEYLESVDPPRKMVEELFCNLKMKGEKFVVDQPASDAEMERPIQVLRELFGEEIACDDTMAKLNSRPLLKQFLDTHCNLRHYHISIKRCGQLECEFCDTGPTLPGLHFLPDPIPDSTGEHYLPFKEVYGSSTTDTHRPSAVKKTKKATLKQKTPTASSSSSMEVTHTSEEDEESVGSTVTVTSKFTSQTACNVQLTLRCGECRKPRVIYAGNKLRLKSLLVHHLEELDFVCGTRLINLVPEEDVSHIFLKVSMKELECSDMVEIPYYSSKVFDQDVCIICGGEVAGFQDNLNKYPTCQICARGSGLGPKKRTYARVVIDID